MIGTTSSAATPFRTTTSPAPIGRYNNMAATLYADGHTASNRLDNLVDVNKWIDTLEHRDYGHRN